MSHTQVTQTARAERTHRASAAPSLRGRSPGPVLAWLLVGGGILAQVAFPLTGGGTFVLTVAAVGLLAAGSLAHALSSRGAPAALALLVVAGGGGFLAEAVGVATGVPFGAYGYTGSLGVEALGVPLLVPCAWVMMAWPALVVGRHLAGARGRGAVALVAAWALACWDVFLDPQMVDAGHWSWRDPTPALPGSPGIPLSNYAGWLLVSLVVTAVLDRVVTRAPPAGGGSARRDAVPLTVYLWTYWSSVLAGAVFFGRPWVALWGAVLMGVVALPLSWQLGRPLVRRRMRGRHR